MGLILSISGCKAVGKSTLIEGLKKSIPDLIVREGFRRVKTGYDTLTEEGYYMNQRVYIDREIKEFKKYLDSGKIVVLLRGPEDLEFYTRHYPKINNKIWSLENNLKNELLKLSECRSDIILYLDAKIETIMKRKINDETKPRENMDEWLNHWQPYIEKHIKSLENTIVLETDNLASEDVLNFTLQLIQKNIVLGEKDG